MKVAQENANADINKQFAHMKSLITTNSSKLDEYVKENDSRIAVVEPNVDIVKKNTVQCTCKTTQCAQMHNQ